MDPNKQRNAFEILAAGGQTGNEVGHVTLHTEANGFPYAACNSCNALKRKLFSRAEVGVNWTVIYSGREFSESRRPELEPN